MIQLPISSFRTPLRSTPRYRQELVCCGASSASLSSHRKCLASIARLGQELSIQQLQTTRYCRGLVQAGYLRETRVAGQPTIRELLLNDQLLNQYKQEQVGGTH
jgi:hypothetical protein